MSTPTQLDQLQEKKAVYRDQQLKLILYTTKLPESVVKHLCLEYLCSYPELRLQTQGSVRAWLDVDVILHDRYVLQQDLQIQCNHCLLYHPHTVHMRRLSSNWQLEEHTVFLCPDCYQRLSKNGADFCWQCCVLCSYIKNDDEAKSIVPCILRSDTGTFTGHAYRLCSSLDTIMGVPQLYRWLVQRYPDIVDLEVDNEILSSVDALYLDMNGIIHTSSHPEKGPAPKTEAEMIANTVRAVQDIIGFVGPRSLVYMAIDGVAPRAKLNHQRARRFRSAKDAVEAEQREALVRQQYGCKQGATTVRFDSNVITPGTAFMAAVSAALRERFCSSKTTTPPQVILSDEIEAGEGEHKILRHIRQSQAGIRHIIYGMDADFILLGLSTHLPHVMILREDLAVLHVDRLRVCLQQEWADDRWLTCERDAQRFIDDLVLLCIFVGNDFLPNLPCLDIREGALSLLFGLYREQWRGFLTDMRRDVNANQLVSLTRLGHLLRCLADKEPGLLRKAHRRNRCRRPARRREHGGQPTVEAAIQEAHRRAEERFLAEQRKVDHVRFHEAGYAERYYTCKFGKAADPMKITDAYIRGLYFVMRYYYDSVRPPSWSWHYPFQYAPLVADLARYAHVPLFPGRFRLSAPLPPLGQLLAVLPPRSRHCLPARAQALMTDANSPIRDFYPADFQLDLNGKFHAWQAIALLPFIDERRLLKVLEDIV